MVFCRLCGGTSGQMPANGAHNLCDVRAKHGRPTPSPGHQCPCCLGSGCHPRSAVGPINPNQDAIDRWAPGCTTCAGRGSIHMNKDDANGWRAHGPRHWAQTCMDVAACAHPMHDSDCSEPCENPEVAR